MVRIPTNTKLLREILTAFIRNEVHKTGLTRGLVGLSGGVDSAVTAVLAAAALASLLLNSAAPLAGYIMAVLALTAWRSRDGAHLALYRRIRPLAVVQSVVLPNIAKLFL